jgi:hypothetical protein
LRSYDTEELHLVVGEVVTVEGKSIIQREEPCDAFFGLGDARWAILNDHPAVRR